MRFLYMALLAGVLLACEPTPAASQPAPPQPEPTLPAVDHFTPLYEAWPGFRERSLTDRRFKHEDIVPILRELDERFTVAVEGQSVEGRDIYRVTIGTGSTTVLLWSQMHGDEPTATAAIFDIFRFLVREGDDFDAMRATILRELKLVFIPMLNPDGADRFQRRNALGIDLNRDALRLTSPESQILKAVRDETDADWGFNLHDQSRYYGAGYPTDEVAVISFLAPAYNFRGEVNATRERAMQLIAQLNDRLQTVIPGHVARYSDAFEPRAFGDNIQKWGTSTILIESGGNPDDREKQEIRQLNFAALLTSFHSIATGGWKAFTRQQYNQIPFNKFGHFNDLLLREVTLERDGGAFLMDISFNLNELDHNRYRDFYYRAGIADVGDLSYQQGYVELAPAGLRVEIAGVYPEVFRTLGEVRQRDPREFLRQGYGVVRVTSPGPRWVRDEFPVLLISADDSYDQYIAPGGNPPLLLRDGQGVVRYSVINGQLYEVETAEW